MDGVWAFEEIDDTLPLVPIAARRALDLAGVHLSLEGWRRLPLEQRRALVNAGNLEVVARSEVLARCMEAHGVSAVTPEEDPSQPPEMLCTYGATADITAAWLSLSRVARYAVLLGARSAAKRGDRARLTLVVRALLPSLIEP